MAEAVKGTEKEDRGGMDPEVVDVAEVNGDGPSEEGGGDCQDLLAAKDEEIKGLHERVLRIAAEMDNTRKRLEREKSEGICYANESLMREMLTVIDNLERAIQHSEQEANFNSLLEGIRMTHKGFLDALARFNCVPFESVGKLFDPNFHEAMTQQESAEHPERTVLMEFEKGYTLNDRLLRPARVVVSKAPARE